jgi:hypothetical protein
MSHTTSIKAVKIQSVNALRSAIAELNSSGTRLTLKENATPRAYFANQAGLGKADFVVEVHGAKYDIGLYKQEDGSYEARTDFWGGSVQAVLGGTATTQERAEQAKMGKLFQMYGIHAATEAARRKGLSVRRITDASTGTIKLELTGANL